MNLNQLYYFNELAKQRQFSKAAKNLYISQPSLSNSIKSLEKELGCKLINRSGGQISLTEYGEIFYKAASSSVNIIEQAKRKIAQNKRQNENVIKIASIPSALSNYLPRITQSFKKNISKNIKFCYQSELSNEIYHNLELGNVDIGVCSKINKHSNLVFLPLYSEKITVLTRRDHPLARYKLITPAELANYDVITYSDKTALGRKIRKTLLEKAPKLNITALLDDETSIAAQVLSNDSVGISVDSNFVTNHDIKKTELDVPKDTRVVYLAYNPKADLSEITKKLIIFMTNLNND